ncbi:hypothetical protein [Niveispirillum irakense]|uniref:hypothetical protein n=1 Tax=Niveispirillum irakense TaxID=34011 RepID=UPI0012B5FDB0|nr:hypothetical protein [Niveispirillum irakense]
MGSFIIRVTPPPVSQQRRCPVTIQVKYPSRHHGQALLIHHFLNAPGNGGGQPMAMDIPPGPQVTDETLACFGWQVLPVFGCTCTQSVDHLVPATAWRAMAKGWEGAAAVRRYFRADAAVVETRTSIGCMSGDEEGNFQLIGSTSILMAL